MNRCFSLFLVLTLLASCGGNGKVKNDQGADILKSGEIGEISFANPEFDFGKIHQGEKVAHIFEFENKGPGSLVIKTVSASCGCTATKYDKKPVPPGQKGSLEVVFDSSGRMGMQTKTVVVHSNSESDFVILKITAEVIE